MHILHEILSYLLHLHWQAFGTYTIAGAVISLAVLAAKALFGTNWGHKFVVFILSSVTTITSALYWYVNSGANIASKSPVPFIAQHSAYLLSLAVVLYHFLISDTFTKRVKPWLQQVSEVKGMLQAAKAGKTAGVAAAQTQSSDPMTTLE